MYHGQEPTDASPASSGTWFRNPITRCSKSSVAAANYNLLANGVDNVQMVRMSSEEIAEAEKRAQEWINKFFFGNSSV